MTVMARRSNVLATNVAFYDDAGLLKPCATRRWWTGSRSSPRSVLGGRARNLRHRPAYDRSHGPPRVVIRWTKYHELALQLVHATIGKTTCQKQLRRST